MNIYISNVKIKGLSSIDFRKNKKYKFFGIGDEFSTLVPFYKELLQHIIGAQVEEKFHDLALEKKQIEQIIEIFSEQIDKTLLVYEDYKGTKIPHKRLEWKGKGYDLHLGLNSPNNRKIDDFHIIITISKECLKQNKPVYLSID